MSKKYLSVDFSKFLLENNGNILLFNKNEKAGSTAIYLFNSKDFSLIQSNNIDNFALFEAKQINENEILLYSNDGTTNYIYNVLNNSCKKSEKYKQINPKLQVLKNIKYQLGWEKPIYLSNGDIVFLIILCMDKKENLIWFILKRKMN